MLKCFGPIWKIWCQLAVKDWRTRQALFAELRLKWIYLEGPHNLIKTTIWIAVRHGFWNSCKKWTRKWDSQDCPSWYIDLLQMYESSTLYDCTFKVGSRNAKGGCQVVNFFSLFWVFYSFTFYVHAAIVDSSLCNRMNLNCKQTYFVISGVQVPQIIILYII